MRKKPRSEVVIFLVSNLNVMERSGCVNYAKICTIWFTIDGGTRDFDSDTNFTQDTNLLVLSALGRKEEWIREERYRRVQYKESN